MPGVFLGDFVKGRLTGKRSKRIELGIQFHRSVDVFVDQHPSQQQSIKLFSPEYRRYGGIICDVVFDHFLARDWSKHADSDFEQFCGRAYEQVLEADTELTETAKETITAMQSHRSLERYQQEAYIDRSLRHIGTRLRRDNPLHQGMEVFDAHRNALESQFESLVPDLKVFAENWLALHHK